MANGNLGAINNTNLSALQALYLAGNPLTGCVPQALRDIPNNDLSTLGLPDCP